ncbi:hypothetical protein IMSAG013_01313 [Clostridiales bacterium]|nr:hypothetical protein IMSAG013_01313 [Clostridiales bacterium]
MAQFKEENEIKIFILYLLDKIGYPLDYPSIGSIMMQDGIVNFFDFAQCFFSLVDAGHIREIVRDSSSEEKTAEDQKTEHDKGDVSPAAIGAELDDFAEDYDSDATVLYEVTDTGRQVAEALSDNLMVTVREKSYRSALRHLSFAKKGAYVDHSYRPDGDGYLVNCSIKDKNGVIMDLTVRADSDYQLQRMLSNYAERPEVVFRGVIALLSGDVNYLFEDT